MEAGWGGREAGRGREWEYGLKLHVSVSAAPILFYLFRIGILQKVNDILIIT